MGLAASFHRSSAVRESVMLVLITHRRSAFSTTQVKVALLPGPSPLNDLATEKQ